MSKKIVIAGGSGFLGRSLAHFLTERGDSVTILSRSMPDGPWAFAEWDGRTVGEWKSSLEGANPELALYGRYVVPSRLLAERFEFKFPDLDAALANIFARA